MKRGTLKEKAYSYGRRKYGLGNSFLHAVAEDWQAGYRAAQRDAKAASIDNPKRKLRILRFDNPKRKLRISRFDNPVT